MTNSNFKIESDVPMPSRAGINEPSFPFEEMRVGDSFAVPLHEHPHKIINKVRHAARHFKLRKGNGLDFATRVSATEIRIWRIA